MILGIDVSFWEPVIDWQKVLQAGYRFAYIKASQNNYSDSLFTTHWKNAKLAGMPRGAFHFLDTASSPKVQAEKFFSLVESDLGELPLALDIEKYISGNYYGSQYWYDFLERLNVLSGNYPTLIYTGYYYWIENVSRGSHQVLDPTYFGKYPLWISRYKATEPLIPSPWTNYLIWQNSDSVLVEGVYDDLGRPTECDTNIFNGTETEFQAILTAEPILITGATPDMTQVLYLADLKSGMSSNIRTAPTLSAGIIKSMTGFLTVAISSEKQTADGYDWYKIVAPYNGYIAYTTSYTNLTPIDSVGTVLPDLNITINLADGDSPYASQNVSVVLKPK